MKKQTFDRLETAIMFGFIAVMAATFIGFLVLSFAYIIKELGLYSLIPGSIFLTGAAWAYFNDL